MIENSGQVAVGTSSLTQDELTSLFIPHIIDRTTSIQSGKRLVHYTSGLILTFASRYPDRTFANVKIGKSTRIKSF